jgi:hypothetical protein
MAAHVRRPLARHLGYVIEPATQIAVTVTVPLFPDTESVHPSPAAVGAD